jgi:hypothetical protein
VLDKRLELILPVFEHNCDNKIALLLYQIPWAQDRLGALRTD